MACHQNYLWQVMNRLYTNYTSSNNVQVHCKLTNLRNPDYSILMQDWQSYVNNININNGQRTSDSCQDQSVFSTVQSQLAKMHQTYEHIRGSVKLYNSVNNLQAVCVKFHDISLTPEFTNFTTLYRISRKMLLFDKHLNQVQTRRKNTLDLIP